MFNLIERNVGRYFGPLGLIAVGLVAGLLAEPAIRKGARRLAVLTTAGVLTAADSVRKVTGEAGSRLQTATGGAREQLDKLVHEAKETGCSMSAEKELGSSEASGSALDPAKEVVATKKTVSGEVAEIGTTVPGA